METDVGARVHRRARRVARGVGARPRDPARRAHRDGRRPLLRDGPRQALGADGSARSRRSSTGSASTADDPVAAVRASYARGVTDEFVEPVVLEGRPRLDPGPDSAIVFNFRPDRVRQLTERLLDRGVDVVTMTRYRDDFDCPVAFAEQRVDRHARRDARRCRPPAAPRRRDGEVRARTVLLQRRGRGAVAGRGADPRPVAARRPELRPEAGDVRARGRDASPRRSATGTRFCVVNFANPDMVGHTGVIPAVVRAVETVDACLGEVVEATHRPGRRLPRHRRPRQRREAPRGRRRQPAHAHTTNPVPLVLTREEAPWDGGELSDLAPTVLELLGLETPSAMTGRSLVVNNR